MATITPKVQAVVLTSTLTTDILAAPGSGEYYKNVKILVTTPNALDPGNETTTIKLVPVSSGDSAFLVAGADIGKNDPIYVYSFTVTNAYKIQGGYTGTSGPTALISYDHVTP
jgi:hypothetical protein